MRRMKKENRILILLIIFAFFLLFPVYDVAAGQQRETITVTLGKTAYLTGPTPMTLIRSTDEKKDGFGDTSFNIPESNHTDWFPLMIPPHIQFVSKG